MKALFEDVSVSAMASCIPANSLDLRTLGKEFGEDEVQRIIASTGISEVRVAQDGVCASDLCEHAARWIFERSAIQPSSIDAIVFVSQTFDHILPATSVLLQNKLGLSKEVAAFDIRYGCSAYVYGLYQASMLVTSGGCQRVLLCAGDVTTRMIHPKDRSIRMVFGDGGSATIVEKGNDTLAFSLMSDGSGAHHLIVPAGGARKPNSSNTSIAVERESGNVRSENDLFMDGMEIMNFALREVPPMIEGVLKLRGWEAAEVGCFAFHQANRFMLDYLRKKMKLGKESVPIAMGFTGNTGPASIPLMFSQIGSTLRAENRLNKSVLCGFGVGLSWGAVCVDLSKTVISHVIDYDLIPES